MTQFKVGSELVAGRSILTEVDAVIGEWRKLHNEKLRALYSLRSIIMIMI
jgi:hypothetical protein